MLPDSPVNAPFLNQREKLIAVKRIAGNRVGLVLKCDFSGSDIVFKIIPDRH